MEISVKTDFRLKIKKEKVEMKELAQPMEAGADLVKSNFQIKLF